MFSSSAVVVATTVESVEVASGVVVSLVDSVSTVDDEDEETDALAFDTLTHFSCDFVAGSQVVAASTIFSSSSSVVTLSSVSASAPLEPQSVSELDESLDSVLDALSTLVPDGDEPLASLSFVDFSLELYFEDDFSLVEDFLFSFSAFCAFYFLKIPRFFE